MTFSAPRRDPGALRKAGPSKYPCRTAGCPALRSSAKLVCTQCWWRIPAELRVELNSAWRAYLRTPGIQTSKAYLEVRARALAACAIGVTQ